MGVHSKYSDVEKLKAVATYVMLGNMTAVATEMEIPRGTIVEWRQQDWWKVMERQIKNEENATLSAKYRKIVQKVQDQLLERLENGDDIVLRDGSIAKVPVKAKDLAFIGAISTDKIVSLDKAQENREETVSIQQRLDIIAKQLMSFSKNPNKREPITLEVIPNNAESTGEPSANIEVQGQG